MSKQQKKTSEKRHKIVQRFLEKYMTGCLVKYNGVEGVDHTIKFQDRKTVCETKTCDKIVKRGLRRVPYRPVIYQNLSLGVFKFRKIQHEKLLEQDGWYLFVVKTQIVGGLKASELNIKFTADSKHISWLNIVSQCYPDWLRRLKCDVYGV